MMIKNTESVYNFRAILPYTLGLNMEKIHFKNRIIVVINEGLFTRNYRYNTYTHRYCSVHTYKREREKETQRERDLLWQKGSP